MAIKSKVVGVHGMEAEEIEDAVNDALEELEDKYIISVANGYDSVIIVYSTKRRDIE
jgi:hypothetical protein